MVIRKKKRRGVTEAMRLRPRPSVRDLEARRRLVVSTAGDLAVLAGAALASIVLLIGAAQ